MSREALALKYRPRTFDEVCSQDSIITILTNQIQTNTWKHAYIMTGPAGCGKTTTARILANEINNGVGSPIELDAASHNSVEDIRDISQQAKTQSLDGEYKIFILDEVHMLSASAWAAMLKLIEEPPAKSIFILATTDIQKVPKTILSRCQRFDFTRIPIKQIVDRIDYVLTLENSEITWDKSALEFIAKLSDGGMRTALTYTDKVLDYTDNITLENVVKALGVANYSNMQSLTNAILEKNAGYIIEKIEKIHADGIDLKQFIKQYTDFILDIKKYYILGNFDYIQIPQTDDNIKWLESISPDDFKNTYWDDISSLLSTLINMQSEIKYDSSPKYYIECVLLEEVNR